MHCASLSLDLPFSKPQEAGVPRLPPGGAVVHQKPQIFTLETSARSKASAQRQSLCWGVQDIRLDFQTQLLGEERSGLRTPACPGLASSTCCSLTPGKMAGPWTFTLLCGLLATTLIQATLSPTAVLILGPKVIKEKLTQELKDHNATSILQQLPLLSTIREQPAGGIPVLGSVVNTVLKYIIWLKVTTANILQLQVKPSANDKELLVKIPLDMVAGFNTPLVKTIVEFHMETEAQAIVHMDTSASGPTRLVLSDCATSDESLRVQLLHKFSFLVNALAKEVMNLLVPALPNLVKNQVSGIRASLACGHCAPVGLGWNCKLVLIDGSLLGWALLKELSGAGYIFKRLFLVPARPGLPFRNPEPAPGCPVSPQARQFLTMFVISGKLRSGVPVSVVKALGFEAAESSLTKDGLVLTPASSWKPSSAVSQ
ncbi:BPI fold-containing family B member 1 [Chlorocebus sabaeus]|uniref:BPI fold-containing family B member 1 n=1 Tax=Chlorocebus sabaeus TaxID=60711 RepID=UPI003BFA1B9B